MKYKGTILVIIPHLGVGGTEFQTLNLVRALIADNYKVRVLCLYRNLPMVVQSYEEAGAEVCIMSPQYNNPDIKILYHKKWALLRFLYSSLKKMLALDTYQVIHIQYMTPGATIILLLYYVFGQRNIITTAHTMADIYPNLCLVHFIQRHCVRAFTCITELAERSFFGTSQLYSEHTPLKLRNHFTIYNALPASFKPLATSRRFTAPFTIGVVSRLETIKGMELVIPAYARVRAQYPDTRLLIVGDGTLRETMMQQAEQLNCKDKIEWTGRQSQESLSEWYRRMDIVLMPSRSEGFGLTAIEAMANGCVVVASNVGGLPEVVRDREVGLLHQVDSVDDMADKITHLLAHPQMLSNYSQAASVYVQRYSFERYSVLFNDLYGKF